MIMVWVFFFKKRSAYKKKECSLSSDVCSSDLAFFYFCIFICFLVFFFKQKTAYEIKECDWSSDVCSSDLCVL